MYQNKTANFSTRNQDTKTLMHSARSALLG